MFRHVDDNLWDVGSASGISVVTFLDYVDII